MGAKPEVLFVRACSRGDVEIIERLLQNGVPLDTTDQYGLTGLILAARKGRIEVAKALLVAGAQLEAKDRRQRTAFFHAVALNRHAFVQYLADAGADINTLDAHGWTPLDVSRGQKKMVALLEGLGARWAYYDGPSKAPVKGTNTFLCGCGATGGHSPSIVEEERRQLSFLMNGWTGSYTKVIDKFAFRPYVDGSVVQLTEQMGIIGASKPTRSKDWLTIKIGIPESWWWPDRTSHKKRIAEAVEQGLHSMIAILQRNRHDIDAEALLADWQTIKELFFATPMFDGRDVEHKAYLLALSAQAASAVVENRKNRGT